LAAQKFPKKSLKKVRGGEGEKKRLAGKTQDFENPFAHEPLF